SGEPMTDLRHQADELAGSRAEERLELVVGCVADDVRERLDERLVGDAEAVVTPAEQGEAALTLNRAGQLGSQARLANAGLAGDQHGAAGAGRRLLPRGGDLLELGVTSGEGEARR